ncbi:MAG TPA: ATP-binding protein [Alphaproteobacteria bacterium]|jgi:hypothetical protein|nr:ATP-binding protein [Alphaproteobacteria bacterium]
MNPFNPNSVVTPSLFAGRMRQIDDICKKLTQLKNGMASSFFVYGERGIGKTALAKLVNYVATSKDSKLHNLDLLTSYYQVESGQNISGVLQASVNKLTDNMDQSLIIKIGERVGNLLKNGKFEIGAFGGSIAFDASVAQQNRDITIKDQTVSILSNILKVLDKSTVDKKDGILIIIDEMHNLGELPRAASIFRNITTSLDFENLGKVSFLLIGYKDDVDDFFSVDTSARRMFDLKGLSVMPDDEAVDILKKGFEAVNVKWDEKSLQDNIKVAGGYPHSVQILGHNLIEEDSDLYIGIDDWDKVIMDTALELQEKEFATMYTFRKKQTDRDIFLTVLAQSEGPITRQEINQSGSVSNVYRCIKDLKKRGAIKEDDQGNISLHSQLFRTAILFDIAMRRISKNDES